MKILDALNSASRAQGLSYVVIGGHAVIARGYARTTRDLDLAVPAGQRAAWKEILALLGYRAYHEQPGFLQLSVPELGEWPIDLMVVDDATFSKLAAGADRMPLGGDEPVPVASVTHLLMMKLHAMKTGPAERSAKDLADVLELLRLRDLDPRDAEFRALCEKYANRETHERIVQFWGGGPTSP